MKRYKEGSGQSVNLSKLAILCNPNVGIEIRKDFGNMLNIHVVSNLGIPSYFSRNKSKDLNIIKERIHKMLAGWKNGFFSIGGKKILIKAIAQVIPVYVMSCVLPLTYVLSYLDAWLAFGGVLPRTSSKYIG